MASKNIVCAPAEERGRLIIEKNEQPILQLMDPERISRHLLSKGVIDSSDRNKILHLKPLGERNRALIGKLLTCGLSGYRNFMDSLHESGTDNHEKLFRILSNDDPIPPGLPVDERLRHGSQTRLNEKVADHEHRLKSLEEEVRDARSDDDVEFIREELIRRNTELDEMRKKLETREGELQETREENRQLQKRIQSLERKIQSLEETLKVQKLKFDGVTRQQQQDKKRIEALENKLDTAEKKMDKKLQDQEKRHGKEMDKKLQDQDKRHGKEMDQIKQMIREQAKLSLSTGTKAGPQPKPSNTAQKPAGTSAKNVATGRQQKEILVAKNRFQDDKAKHVPPAQPPIVFKKSTSVPEPLPPAKHGYKRSK